MPVFKKIDGFEIVIYPNDHLPKHVHVFKNDGELKINPNPVGELPEIISGLRTMGKKDGRKAFRLVVEYQAELLEMWDKYHDEKSK